MIQNYSEVAWTGFQNVRLRLTFAVVIRTVRNKADSVSPLSQKNQFQVTFKGSINGASEAGSVSVQPLSWSSGYLGFGRDGDSSFNFLVK